MTNDHCYCPSHAKSDDAFKCGAARGFSNKCDCHCHPTSASHDPQKELERLKAENLAMRVYGWQMYRAICYTSGVDLNFAADEWKKFAPASTSETPPTPAKEREVRICDCLNGRRGDNCLDYHPLISPKPQGVDFDSPCPKSRPKDKGGHNWNVGMGDPTNCRECGQWWNGKYPAQSPPDEWKKLAPSLDQTPTAYEGCCQRCGKNYVSLVLHETVCRQTPPEDQL